MSSSMVDALVDCLSVRLFRPAPGTKEQTVLSTCHHGMVSATLGFLLNVIRFSSARAACVRVGWQPEMICERARARVCVCV